MNQSAGCPYKVDISNILYLATYLVEVRASTLSLKLRLLDSKLVQTKSTGWDHASNVFGSYDNSIDLFLDKIDGGPNVYALTRGSQALNRTSIKPMSS